MSEEHVFDLLPGYALGSLDEDDLLVVVKHLPACEICQSELGKYRIVVDQVVLSSVPYTPPSSLKQRVLQKVVRQPRPAIRSHQEPKQRAAGILGQLFSRPLASALGMLAVLLIALMGASSWLFWQELNRQKAANTALAQQVADLQAQINRSDMQIVHLQGTNNAPGAQGYLMIFPDQGYGTLVIEDMPLLQPGYQYQLWLIRDGKRTSGGVFSVNEQGYGTLEISASQPLNQFPSFGVTIEPEGGSAGPTGDKVLGGEL